MFSSFSQVISSEDSDSLLFMGNCSLLAGSLVGWCYRYAILVQDEYMYYIQAFLHHCISHCVFDMVSDS